MSSEPVDNLTEGDALSCPAAATLDHRKRGVFFLCLAVGCVGFTMALQMGLNSNFTAGELHLTGLQQGLLETVRESCGIFALFLLAMMAGLAEPLVGAGMLVLVAFGLGSYVVVPDYLWAVLMSLVWSQGLHIWMPLPNSMALALAEPGATGRRLGQVQAAGAAGSGAGLVAALLLHVLGVPIRPLYALAGAAAIFGALACLGIPRQIKTPGERMVFRRKYILYYLLCFLEGWRKQIFLAFAGYMLVKMYDVSLMRMLVLWIVIQAVGYFASPLAGRLIDRIGERRVLVMYFSCLTACFVSYALLKNSLALQAVFVIDSSFFVFGMAMTTYVSRIAPPREHTATLSMGVAANHVAAVTMPLVGGLLWNFLGYQWVFFLGSAAAAASILVALQVPRHKANEPPASMSVEPPATTLD